VSPSQAGYRLILVDAHLRRPRLAEMLQLSSGYGLTNVIANDVPVETALQTWRKGSSLEVLASGPTPRNPSELLALSDSPTC
jgi:Mrp family chromosome partitioning ATPase